MAFDNNAYGDITKMNSGVAGRDVLLSIWDAKGENLLAVGGQQGFTLTKGTETLDASSKDGDGWSAKMAGAKEWSIEADGVFKSDDEALQAMSKAFDTGDYVCIKVVDVKRQKNLYGGIALIAEYALEAPYDDMMTWSATFEGVGPLKEIGDLAV